MLSWGVWWRRYRQIALMMRHRRKLSFELFLMCINGNVEVFREVELARILHFLRPSGELNGVQRGFLFRYEFQEKTTLEAYNST
ncbi:hypothetical protein CEXT_417321 [Caerostris extrusa]|uniref:Uncharacterized protein n=1 Tax=Caerostris extrusa TaxID=172846 RepID=A0AAV4MZ48_CAEEX|nr:hypothetical protein CEXT_417321 [Caerostris extrusa]